jgi:hypothetical protein
MTYLPIDLFQIFAIGVCLGVFISQWQGGSRRVAGIALTVGLVNFAIFIGAQIARKGHI